MQTKCHDCLRPILEISLAPARVATLASVTPDRLPKVHDSKEVFGAVATARGAGGSAPTRLPEPDRIGRDTGRLGAGHGVALAR